MNFDEKNIEAVWENICKYEGETFYTITNKEYTYVVKDNYILGSNDSRRRITKENITKALKVKNPTPSNLNLWDQSYIYGIITDSRIMASIGKI